MILQEAVAALLGSGLGAATEKATATTLCVVQKLRCSTCCSWIHSHQHPSALLTPLSYDPFGSKFTENLWHSPSGSIHLHLQAPCNQPSGSSGIPTPSILGFVQCCLDAVPRKVEFTSTPKSFTRRQPVWNQLYWRGNQGWNKLSRITVSHSEPGAEPIDAGPQVSDTFPNTQHSKNSRCPLPQPAIVLMVLLSILQRGALTLSFSPELCERTSRQPHCPPDFFPKFTWAVDCLLNEQVPVCWNCCQDLVIPMLFLPGAFLPSALYQPFISPITLGFSSPGQGSPLCSLCVEPITLTARSLITVTR